MSNVTELVKQPNPLRLRQAREQAGLSRSQMADKSGMTSKMVENIELGWQEPFAWQIGMWAEATGKTESDLYDWAEPGKFLRRKNRHCRKLLLTNPTA